MPSGLISTSAGSSGLSKISAASFENGSTERPWKELVQSTCIGSSSVNLIGWSDSPDERDCVVGFGGTVVREVSGGGWLVGAFVDCCGAVVGSARRR